MTDLYHLKWDSHLSYLNSSIATLYKNEKYADVVLYSSSSTAASCSSAANSGSHETGIPTVGISAHKFILSSCSQFFATMFETAPVCVPNGSVLYVVLPPELSHRAIQILVQYMYIGEATVPNDILNEVLRGGEVLKIRGLCRNSASSASSSAAAATASSAATSLHQTLHPADKVVAPYPQSGYSSHQQPEEMFHPKSLYRDPLNASRYSLEHLQYPAETELRHLTESIVPKESPVIIKTKTKGAPVSVPASLPPLRLKATKGITINKDVAIDPDSGKCAYEPMQQAPEHLPLPLKTPVASSMCNEIGCNSCTLPLALSESEEPARDKAATSLRLRDYAVDERDDLPAAYATNLRRPLCRDQDCFNSDLYGEPVAACKQLPESGEAASFVQIKEEPREWPLTEPLENLSNVIGEQRLNRSGSLDKSLLLGYEPPAIVKVEKDPVLEHKNDDNEKILRGGYDCEVCKATFSDVKIWMCHMETHGESALVGMRCREVAGLSGNELELVAKGAVSLAGPKSYVPKKKRRISQQENTEDHVTLLCDLCSKSFKTPADWVRHMNSQHTEMELALFNSSKRDNEPKIHSASSASPMKHHASSTATTNIISLSASSSSSSSVPTRASPPPPPSAALYAANPQEYPSDRVCNICRKTFISHSIMTAHKQSHSINAATCNGNSLSGDSRGGGDSGGRQHHHHQQPQQMSTPAVLCNETRTPPSNAAAAAASTRLYGSGDGCEKIAHDTRNERH